MPSLTDPSRRRFLQHSSMSASLLLTGWERQEPEGKSDWQPGPICLFSKHLPMLGWEALGEAVGEAGFDGVDLTVRPGGHVLPARAVEELPLAHAAIRRQGLALPMITTNLTRADEPHASSLLRTAGQLAIPFFKPGYYPDQDVDPVGETRRAMDSFAKLAALGASHRIVAGFHNHTGSLGSVLSEIDPAMRRIPPAHAGYYFDIRHAVCEGGGNGWRLAFHHAASRLRMIAIKDFFWARTESGWKPVDTPLGGGMVNWPLYFRKLCQVNFRGPVSLHLEYPLEGRTSTERRREVLLAAQRDLTFVRRLIEESRQS
ncbi:MAG: sugar phosphate isomerase/epimerase family protein [Blastocatellia bacterium]